MKGRQANSYEIHIRSVTGRRERGRKTSHGLYTGESESQSELDCGRERMSIVGGGQGGGTLEWRHGDGLWRRPDALRLASLLLLLLIHDRLLLVEDLLGLPVDDEHQHGGE